MGKIKAPVVLLYCRELTLASHGPKYERFSRLAKRLLDLGCDVDLFYNGGPILSARLVLCNDRGDDFERWYGKERVVRAGPDEDDETVIKEAIEKLTTAPAQFPGWQCHTDDVKLGNLPRRWAEVARLETAQVLQKKRDSIRSSTKKE